jgi:thiol-disulfide isomerase/thioredoxin
MRLIASLCVATAIALAILGVAPGIDTRQPAPKFTATDMNGTRYSNDAVKGKVVLLQFWTTWCGYCRRDQPSVDKLAKEFAGKNLIILGVNAGEPTRKVKQYLDQSPRAVPIVLMGDTNLAAMFSAKAYPYYVLIDAEGKIAGEQRGSGGEDALRRLLQKANIQ